MRFIVYGAGAIGSTIGGHLFRTGHDVVLVANMEHVDKIRKSGLRLVTPDEAYTFDRSILFVSCSLFLLDCCLELFHHFAIVNLL